MRTWAVFWAAEAALLVLDFGFVDRFRVWPRTLLGTMKLAVNTAMAMSFKVFLLWVFSGPIVPKTNAAVRMTHKVHRLVAR